MKWVKFLRYYIHLIIYEGIAGQFGIAGNPGAPGIPGIDGCNGTDGNFFFNYFIMKNIWIFLDWKCCQIQNWYKHIHIFSLLLLRKGPRGIPGLNGVDGPRGTPGFEGGKGEKGTNNLSIHYFLCFF